MPKQNILQSIKEDFKKLTPSAKKVAKLVLESYEYYDEGIEISSSFLIKVEKYFENFENISNISNISFENKIQDLLHFELKNKKINRRELKTIISIIFKNNILRIEKYRQKSTESYLVEGAKNKHGFEIEAPKSIDRLKRRIKKQGVEKINGIVLMYFDIDEFKKFNDNYGHSFGDKVIKKLGKLMIREIYSTDIPGHLHGDELAILLNETNAKFLSTVGEGKQKSPLERFKNKLDNLEIKVNKKTVKFTVSCGMAEIGINASSSEREVKDFLKRDSLKTIQELIDEADNNLQKAKKLKIAGVESTIVLPNGKKFS